MPNGLAQNACQVFFLFASVADCFLAIGRGDCSPGLLLTAIEAFLAKFVEVWGADPFIPKFHWLLHYARELRKHETLFACFVHERKHKCIRRYAVPTVNTRTYERTVLEEVTCQHMYSLSIPDSFSFEVGLLMPKVPKASAKEALRQAFENPDKIEVEATSAISRFNQFETCQSKDVVLVRIGRNLEAIAAAEIWLHARVNGGIEISVMSLWTLTSFNEESRSADWIINDEAYVGNVADILATMIWKPIEDRLARTLIPSDLLKYFK